MDSFGTDVLALAPLLTLTIVTLLVLLSESILKKSESVSFLLTAGGLILSIGVAITGLDSHGTAFHGMVRTGGMADFFSILFFISALCTVILSRDYLQKSQAYFGEFYLLVLFATMGMVLMAAAADLIVVFLGIELMSICLYILAGFIREKNTANESSLKYFLLGSFATGFLLYGIAFIYGTMGTTNIPFFIEHFSSSSSSQLLWTGIGLFVVGLAFKIGAVPFHMWVPDVYQGSPTTVSGFMATGAKAAAFSVFVMMFAMQFVFGERLQLLIAVLAAVSMLLGNIVAIAQSNVKRMLAYSSVAHAGYMLIGIAAGNALGRTGILFYLFAYAFMNLGAFGIISLIEGKNETNLSFDDYNGLSTKKPILALLMSLFMFSLAGIPPLGGFFGKYYLFMSAVNANLTWLAIVGVVSSVISVYYYLRLVMVMYFKSDESTYSLSFSTSSLLVLLLTALAILQLGIFPSTLLAVIDTIR